jgi:hypothetical protein
MENGIGRVQFRARRDNPLQDTPSVVTLFGFRDPDTPDDADELTNIVVNSDCYSLYTWQSTRSLNGYRAIRLAVKGAAGTGGRTSPDEDFYTPIGYDPASPVPIQKLQRVWIDDVVFSEPLEAYQTLTDAIAGEYFKATLTELGYDVPTNGTAYSVKAYGLPAGLKLVSNKAVTKKVKKGKKTVTVVVKPAKSEWWIEGVPTAALDYFTNPPYLVITAGDQTTTESLPIQVAAQNVTDLGELALGQKINEQFYLPGVTNGWSVSGLPPGLKYTSKLLKKTKKKGKKMVSVTTNALPYSVYGKTTKAGLFTITAKKKKGAYYETMKYQVLVTPKTVDASLFSDSLMNITTMAYVPFEWNLTNDVSSVGGKVAKVSGLPKGLTFAAANTYRDKKKTKLKQAGQTIVGKPTKAGTYVVTFTKNVKEKKKTVAKTAQILWKVVANDAEVSLGFNTAGGVVESGSVGLKYGDLLAFSATSNATVKASNLPKGIKLVNLGDGNYAFAGYTAKAGTYLVTVTATLNGKTVRQRIALKVEGLPSWAKGKFAGTLGAINENPANSGKLRGLMTLSVTSVGKISGKLMEFGTNWTLKASCYDEYSGDSFGALVTASYAYTTTKKVKGKRKRVTNYLTRTFSLDVDDGGVVNFMECLNEFTPNSPIAHAILLHDVWGNAELKARGKKLFYTSKKNPYRVFTIKGGTETGDWIGLTAAETLSLKVKPSGAVTAVLSFDTGRTKKDKKTKKTVKVIYKATFQTVLIPIKKLEGSDSLIGTVPLYFSPSPANGFDGYAGKFGGENNQFGMMLQFGSDGSVTYVPLAG